MSQSISATSCLSSDQACICSGNDYENLSTIDDDLETCLVDNCAESEWDAPFTVLEQYCYGMFALSFNKHSTDSSGFISLFIYQYIYGTPNNIHRRRFCYYCIIWCSFHNSKQRQQWQQWQ